MVQEIQDIITFKDLYYLPTKKLNYFNKEAKLSNYSKQIKLHL